MIHDQWIVYHPISMHLRIFRNINGTNLKIWSLEFLCKFHRVAQGDKIHGTWIIYHPICKHLRIIRNINGIFIFIRFWQNFHNINIGGIQHRTPVHFQWTWNENIKFKAKWDIYVVSIVPTFTRCGHTSRKKLCMKDVEMVIMKWERHKYICCYFPTMYKEYNLWAENKKWFQCLITSIKRTQKSATQYCIKKSLNKEMSINLKFLKFPFCTASWILKIIQML